MSNGQDGKDDGMRRVDAHANEAWKMAADIATVTAALALPKLTADDVHKRINPNVYTHDLRALGPVMKRAARNGWIEKAPEPGRETMRPSSHRRPLQVWNSLIYKGEKHAAQISMLPLQE